MQPSFSDSDTTGESSTEDAPRTQSDYDDEWVCQLIKRIDQYMSSTCEEIRVLQAWTALQSVIEIQRHSLRDLRHASEETETRVQIAERERGKADASLQQFTAYILTQIRSLSMSDDEKDIE